MVLDVKLPQEHGSNMRLTESIHLSLSSVPYRLEHENALLLGDEQAPRTRRPFPRLRLDVLGGKCSTLPAVLSLEINSDVKVVGICTCKFHQLSSTSHPASCPHASRAMTGPARDAYTYVCPPYCTPDQSLVLPIHLCGICPPLRSPPREVTRAGYASE